MIMTIDLVTGEVTSDAAAAVRSESSCGRVDWPRVSMPDPTLEIRRPEASTPAFPEALVYRDMDAFLDEMRP